MRRMRAQVKRCDEMARRLRYFKDQVAKLRPDFHSEPAEGDLPQFDEVEVRSALLHPMCACSCSRCHWKSALFQCSAAS